MISKKIDISMFFLFVTMATFAQGKMSVVDFQLAEMDLTANTKETIVLDQNGNKCALIKIRTLYGYTKSYKPIYSTRELLGIANSVNLRTCEDMGISKGSFIKFQKNLKK